MYGSYDFEQHDDVGGTAADDDVDAADDDDSSPVEILIASDFSLCFFQTEYAQIGCRMGFY